MPEWTHPRDRTWKPSCHSGLLQASAVSLVRIKFPANTKHNPSEWLIFSDVKNEQWKMNETPSNPRVDRNCYWHSGKCFNLCKRVKQLSLVIWFLLLEVHGQADFIILFSFTRHVTHRVQRARPSGQDNILQFFHRGRASSAVQCNQMHGHQLVTYLRFPGSESRK